MRNALIYHSASGQAFFSGVAFIQFAALLSLGTANRWRDRSRTISAALGLLLVAASATPLPVGFYAVAATATVVWVLAEGTAIGSSPRFRRPLLAVVVLAWWLGVALELPYHLSPRLPRMGRPTLVVVGDSITAGTGGESKTWPGVLARRHRVEVRDFSAAGATAATAAKQAARVKGPRALVLAEIGGNDLLGDTPPRVFEAALDALLTRLKAGRNLVLLMELPLPPTYNRFGAIQRRLARKHGALLIPKRVLLGVLVVGGATLDSIHLTPAGHARMAETIWQTIRQAYHDPIPSPPGPGG